MRTLTEKDHVGTNGPTGRFAGRGHVAFLVESQAREGRSAFRATAGQKRSVQVKDPRVARFFAQRVDVLCDVDDVGLVAPLLFEFSDRKVRGIGFGLIVGFNAAVDRIEHELRAVLHVYGVHAIGAIPVVVGIAVGGNAAFGRKTGARKDHDDGTLALDLHRLDAEVGKGIGSHFLFSK